MFLLYQCQLICEIIGNPLSIILFSQILFNLMLILEAINVDETNVPHVQGHEVHEKLSTINDFQSQKGIESLNRTTNQEIQTTLINEKELITSRSFTDAVKNNDLNDLEFYKNIKTNDSTNNWNDLITNIEEEKDIICWYRKTSDDTVIKTAEDWQKLLDIAKGYKIYSVQNSGSKYLICLKKINNTEVITTETSLDTILLNEQNNKNRRSNNKNININTNQNHFNSEEDCNEDDVNENNKTEEDVCLENNKSTIPVLENVASNYFRKKKDNKYNLLYKKKSLDKNMNINNENKLIHKKGYKRHSELQNMNGHREKHARTINHSSMSISISTPQNTYKNKQKPKLNPLLKRPKSQIKNFKFLYNRKCKNSFNKKIIKIPFIFYLHKLQPLSIIQNKNSIPQNILKYNQPISSCTNKHEIFLLPLGLLTSLDKHAFENLKINNQMNIPSKYQEYNNYDLLPTKLLTPEKCLLSQKGSNSIDPKDFNIPFDMNVKINNPILDQNENNYDIPISMLTSQNYEQLSDKVTDNIYKVITDNIENNVKFRMLDEDINSLNGLTTESIMKIENTTQYLNLSNDTINTITNNENTILQNNVIN